MSNSIIIITFLSVLQDCPGTPGVTAFDPETKSCIPIECAFCYFTCPEPSGFFAVPGTWYIINFNYFKNVIDSHLCSLCSAAMIIIPVLQINPPPR